MSKTFFFLISPSFWKYIVTSLLGELRTDRAAKVMEGTLYFFFLEYGIPLIKGGIIFFLRGHSTWKLNASEHKKINLEMQSF